MPPEEAASPGPDATPEAPARAPRGGRSARAARGSGKIDPNHAPFTGYLERDALRRGRETGRRRMLIVSIAIHVIVFASLLIYSVFQVEELWGPSVEVKVFSPSKLPPGVRTPKPAASAPPP